MWVFSFFHIFYFTRTEKSVLFWINGEKSDGKTR